MTLNSSFRSFWFAVKYLSEISGFRKNQRAYFDSGFREAGLAPGTLAAFFRVSTKEVFFAAGFAAGFLAASCFFFDFAIYNPLLWNTNFYLVIIFTYLYIVKIMLFLLGVFW